MIEQASDLCFLEPVPSFTTEIPLSPSCRQFYMSVRRSRLWAISNKGKVQSSARDRTGSEYTEGAMLELIAPSE